MSEVAALRQLVEDLAARVAAIENGLILENAELRLAGFTAHEAALLALVLQRPIASRQAAMIVLYGALPDDPPAERVLDQYMMRIRDKLRARGLPTPLSRQGAGWFLTEAAKYDIRKRLGLSVTPTRSA
jgi:DNA-binding response OmpR family regulator